MHRVTPAHSAYIGYTGGGTRSVVEKVDDTKLMQEMGGNFMNNEARTEIESPQNYGFTSVVMDADKGPDGKMQGAEAMISFMGSNRTFPVASVMDDRRHRLKDLEKGDVAMFRTKDDNQQFHLTKDGGFWSAPTDKKVRMQLVEKDQQQDQQGQQGTSQGGSQGGQSGGSQQQGGFPKMTGQKAVYKKESKRYFEINKDTTENVGSHHKMMLDDKETAVEIEPKKKEVYLGGLKEKHKFSRVMTEDGPAKNTLARIDQAAVRSAPSSVVPPVIALLFCAAMIGSVIIPMAGSRAIASQNQCQVQQWDGSKLVIEIR